MLPSTLPGGRPLYATTVSSRLKPPGGDAGGENPPLFSEKSSGSGKNIPHRGFRRGTRRGIFVSIRSNGIVRGLPSPPSFLRDPGAYTEALRFPRRRASVCSRAGDTILLLRTDPRTNDGGDEGIRILDPTDEKRALSRTVRSASRDHNDSTTTDSLRSFAAWMARPMTDSRSFPSLVTKYSDRSWMASLTLSPHGGC